VKKINNVKYLPGIRFESCERDNCYLGETKGSSGLLKGGERSEPAVENQGIPDFRQQARAIGFQHSPDKRCGVDNRAWNFCIKL
jgi:hypothetical protein